MKPLHAIQRHLGMKLFLSYLVIILVGVLSLAITAELVTPTILARHTTRMQEMMGGDFGMSEDLLSSFRTAINELLLLAAVAALLTAIIVSTFVTRRIIKPIQAMTKASQRIAAGHYQERIQPSGSDELARLAMSFNQMAHVLYQTEARRRRLIGDVAHELRTPLGNIKGIMEALQDGVFPAEPATFHDVEREVGRLQRLVTDLEELSRAEAGQIVLEPQRISANSLVRLVAQQLRPQFEDKEVNLMVELSEAPAEVEVDRGRMTQVLLNLLGNALQYSAAGGVVRLLVTRQPDTVIISVQDNGIGIAPEHLPYIFERFYRVDKSRSRAGGGSGIGLTISKYLVESHGGRLTATSQGEGHGSQFTVYLPVS